MVICIYRVILPKRPGCSTSGKVTLVSRLSRELTPEPSHCMGFIMLTFPRITWSIKSPGVKWEHLYQWYFWKWNMFPRFLDVNISHGGSWLLHLLLMSWRRWPLTKELGTPGHNTKTIFSCDMNGNSYSNSCSFSKGNGNLAWSDYSHLLLDIYWYSHISFHFTALLNISVCVLCVWSTD